MQDLLAEFGPVDIRSMFSGAGVYADGVMFALLANDTLYLKADADFARDFEAEGKRPFTYRPKGGKPVAMSYWEVPERLLDDPSERAGAPRSCHRRGSRDKAAAAPLMRLDAVEVFDDRFDVVRIEDEDRHVGMAGHDAFGERFSARSSTG